MKKILLIFVEASIIMMGSCERTPDSLPLDEDQSLVKISDGEIIPGQYIVLLKDGVTSLKSAKLSYANAQVLMMTEMQKVLQASNIPEKEPLFVYTASIEGFAVKLSGEEAKALEKNSGVLGIWPDETIILSKPDTKPNPPVAQVTPYGIDRVGGVTTYEGTNKVWIIDTGIDFNHPDLNVDITFAVNFFRAGFSADDDNGHGTHVAGIIAAKDNTVGVVGIAAGALVVPVKVLNLKGSGTISTVIAGVDYVTANGNEGDVVNMSLGGGASDALDLKVEAMADEGLFVALSAGNNGRYAGNYSPARVENPNVYTVSACDNLDVFATWSNFGNPPVDYCAPGVNIYSTYKGGKYATMSGTSMAAPHMSGVLFVTGGHPSSDGTVTGDSDSTPDLIVHR